MEAAQSLGHAAYGRVTAVSIKGYRSVRSIRFPVEPLNVFVGQNGVGKTNLYRGLYLVHAAAKGTITREIAEEGGVESVLWAGARKAREPVRLMLSAELAPFSYRIEIGLPSLSHAALNLEPRVREEELLFQDGVKKVVLMYRNGPSVMIRDEDGRSRTEPNSLLGSETALASFRDVIHFMALEAVRRELLDWRFYHDFRTDRASPLRQPCLALSTPTLSADGHDLAAALATVFDIKGDPSDIHAAVHEAFPGAELTTLTERGRSSFAMRFSDMPRAFAAHEQSEGTLRYLCLIGALCGYRLPGFIALNEPEASLHPNLIKPLAGLIARASRRTRIWIVTHSEALGAEIERLTGVPARTVVRQGGATWIEGLTATGEFAD